MRTTTIGLQSNVTAIRIIRRTASRKHSRGIYIGPSKHDPNVIEYRSDYNGGVYYALLANVRIDGALRKRRLRAA